MEEDNKTVRTSFGVWYDRNKSTLSNKRKVRYRTDPEYRNKILKRQEKYREDNARPKRAKGSFVMINGHRIEVFRISKMCSVIGKDEQTVRNWERSEVIPKHSIKGAHRRYTMHQIMLVKTMSDLLTECRYQKVLRVKTMANQKALIKQQWEQY